jgi:hypothetical protein
MKKQILNLLILTGIVLSTRIAHADIMFFDLNYSINEVEAMRKVARDRNEKLLLYPDRSNVDETQMDKQWRLVDQLQSQLMNCQTSKDQSKCAEINKKLKEANSLMAQLTSKINRIEEKELDQIVGDVRADQSISAIVFSGHSGLGGFAGIFGGLMFEDIKLAFEKHPSALKNTSTILLWGCYSGTLDLLYNKWQKTFPTVKLIAGYEKMSPRGIRPKSGQLLYNLFKAEPKLLASSSLTEAHSIFKSINLIADLDVAAVIKNYFISYAEAESIDEMLKRCDQFPEYLYNKYLCYNSADKGCENPPADHHGALRDFYSYIQINSHCIDLKKEKYPEIPSKEYLIRLIYNDHIKSNFRDHNKKAIEQYSKRLTEIGQPQDYSIENYLSQDRAHNMALDKSFQNTFEQLGFNDKSYWKSPFALTMTQLHFSQDLFRAAINMPSGFGSTNSTNIPYCTPFNWVDLGSTEEDNCSFREYLAEPLSDTVKYVIEDQTFSGRIYFEAMQINTYCVMGWDTLEQIKTKPALKKLILNNLLKKKTELELKTQYLTAYSRELLLQLPALISVAEAMTEDQLIQNMLQGNTDLIKFITELKTKIDPNNSTIVATADNYIIFISEWSKILKSLN